MTADSPSEIPVTQLPSKSFMMFPRITGFFQPDHTNPYILYTGSALPHGSPVFREGLQEIQHIEYATKIFKRSLCRRASAHSSPVTAKHQGDWHALHRG